MLLDYQVEAEQEDTHGNYQNILYQKIEIFDSNGKTVMQENSINRTSSSINLTNKVNGTYIVVVSTMNSKYYKKITLIK